MFPGVHVTYFRIDSHSVIPLENYKIRNENPIDRHKAVFPVSRASLFSNSPRHIKYSPVDKIWLRTILHLYDKTLPALRLAVNVIYHRAFSRLLLKLFLVKILYLSDRIHIVTVKHSIEKPYQYILRAFSCEENLEPCISKRVYICPSLFVGMIFHK